jgi:hypothetical protein
VLAAHRSGLTTRYPEAVSLVLPQSNRQRRSLAARRREKQPEIAYRGSCKYVFRDRTVSSGRVTSIRMLCRTL